MTPIEFVSDLRRLGKQDFNVVMHFMADHLLEQRLWDGRRILDQIDMQQWLKEVAEAARVVPCLGYPKSEGVNPDA